MKKSQKSKVKSQKYSSKLKTFYFLTVVLPFTFLLFTFPAYSKEITILYTGQTHAMLYPCDCPKQPDGGLPRRSSLIKQIRKNNPDVLLLDSGGFFAGGLLDQYLQNTQMDMQRTQVNLKAMELMKYDALCIGDNEFNFGSNFLKENIAKTSLNFLSCNVKLDKAQPFIIKDVGGFKVGIIGVTNPASREKSDNLKVEEPKSSVSRSINDLKAKGVDIIVLLSQLGEDQDLNLIKDCLGIDILISGHSFTKDEPFSKVDGTLILRPSWQGRKMGKIKFSVKDKKIVNYKVEELRLWDKISEDKEIYSIIPRCFSDYNCSKKGIAGACLNPGTLNASCSFAEPSKINLSIIMPRTCRTCDTEVLTKALKQQFPGIASTFIYYPDSEKAKELMREFSISGLPAYVFGKEIENDKNFSVLQPKLQKKGDYYWLSPEFGGFSFMPDRTKIKGKLDLFLSLYDVNTPLVLERLKPYNPEIHFLDTEQAGKFDAPAGNIEVEEGLRCVCVKNYYPEYFWDYITCRAKNISSSWWEDCLGKLDSGNIRTCSRSNEGTLLLKQNISLNKELQVMYGPTYFVDNQEIFSSKGAPSEDELKKILKR